LTKALKELAIQYIPHTEVGSLSSEDRIAKLLEYVKENKIVLLEGQLKKNEETKLIMETMKQISKRFKGIELATIHPQIEDMSIVARVRNTIGKVILGKKDGLTVIGPATIVEQIKQDPKSLQVFSLNLSN